MKDHKFKQKFPQVFEIPKRIDIVNLSVSVIIPCHHEDAYLLKNLLKIYLKQTVLPQEIVISCSGLNQMTNKQKQKLDKLVVWSSSLVDINVKWSLHKGSLLPGGNKNAACSVAVGDIIIVQDADDIPHVQRVEIIKWWFDHYDINHLGHTFIRRYESKMISSKSYLDLTYNRNRFKSIEYMISYRRLPEFFHQMPKSLRVKITNGEVAFLRSLFSEMGHRWDDKLKAAEDTRFNRLVESKYRKSINLVDKLIIYNRVKQIKK